MNRRRVVALACFIVVGAVLFVAFAPIVGVQAEPVGAIYQSTVIATEGNQTKTITLVYDWPTEPSVASLSYCYWGSGALLQNGTYHPFVVSHTLIGGEWCPAIKP